MTRAKLSLLLFGWMTAAGCTSAGPLAPPPIAGTVSRPAPIHDVRLIESAVTKGSWMLNVKYGLPGGCAAPGGYVLKESFPHQVRINILMPADPSTVCTMIYSYGTYDIELGGGYEVCKSYDIPINGTTQTVKALSPPTICRAEAAAQ